MGRRLLLVRHAETLKLMDVHPRAWELSEAGHAAGRDLARAVSLEHDARVFSSPERKATQTAEYCARTFTIIDDLREHVVGSSRWLAPAELDAALRAYFAQGEQRAFGDESRNEAAARFRASLEFALTSTTGDVIIVSHGRIIASYLGSLLETSGYEIWKLLTMPAVITLANPDSAPRIETIRCFGVAAD